MRERTSEVQEMQKTIIETDTAGSRLRKEKSKASKHGWSQRHQLIVRTSVPLFLLIFATVLYINSLEVLLSSFGTARRLNLDHALSAPEKRLVSIPTNPDATLAGDIDSIVHSPEESAIYVNLKPGVRCPRPSLRGRLSGPALVTLDWTHIQQHEVETTNSTTVMKGSYQVPFSGQYYIEIIAMFCKDFLDSRNSSSGDERSVGDALVDENFNFQHTCVEDTWNHRVTAVNASITVDSETSTNNRMAHWVREKDGGLNQTGGVPMHTRFQPQGCRDAAPHCEGPMSTDRFTGYLFSWPNNTDLSAERLRREERTTICFVGWSHSRHIVEALSRIGFVPEIVNVDVVWGKAKFPHEVNAASLPRIISDPGRCNKLIIGVGQWSAGYPDRRPALFREYYEQVMAMLSTIHEGFPNIEIFARSIHYNPMGDVISQCPPKDWRNPDVIDGYNFVIQKACRELGGSQSNISYIDTKFIVGPMWDSSPDWCHLSEDVQRVEALYLVAVALGILPRDNKNFFPDTTVTQR